MMRPRAFLGVIGAFTLIGALVWLWSPITLHDTDVEGKAVACGDVFSSDSGNAAVADQPNEMGRTLTESRYTYPDRDYVTECRDATRMRQVWAIPRPSSAVHCCSAPCPCIGATADPPAENYLHPPKNTGWRDHRLEPCPATRPTNPERKALQWYDPRRSPLRWPTAWLELH